MTLPTIKRLYPFQRDACNSTVRALQKGVRKVIICMPTAAGKTYTTVKLCDGLIEAFLKQKVKANILWVVHRDSLAEQAAIEFQETAPHLRVTSWTSTSKDATGDVVIAMIGSTRTLQDKFTIVIVDEAHHLAAEDVDAGYHGNMYTRLLKKIKWGYLLGLTATPTRLDGRQLDFEEVAYSIRFLDLVRARRLARPIYMEVLTKDAYSMSSARGDFTKKALKKLNNPVRNGKIADIYMRHRDKFGKTLMFVTGVEHCHHMRAEILKRDPNAHVAVLTGKDPKKYREAVMVWFREGGPEQKKLLVNCEIFTEGFDAPSCKTVVLARPTMSKTLWMQMVGRGARIMHETFNVYAHDFDVVEDVGDQGVKRIKFSNGGEYLGDDLGVVQSNGQGDLHLLRLQMDDEFYLVNIMDDITKFATLCQEWELEVRDLTDDEIEELEQIQVLREKRARVQVLEEGGQVQSKRGGDWGTLGDEQIRDLIGILTVSTFYHNEIGFAIDPDRSAALQRLRHYAQGCYQLRKVRVPKFDVTGAQTIVEEEDWIFDRDKFALAYGHCCIKGEFPFKFFERIRWAFYFRYIRQQEQVKSSVDNRWYKTWNYYPVIDMTPESRESYVAQAKADVEAAKESNDEYNEEYGELKKATALLQLIKKKALEYAEEMDEGKKKKRNIAGVKYISRIVAVARSKDRKLDLFSTDIIKTWYQMSRNGRTAELFGEAMREILDDPACVVTIKPQAVLVDKKGEGAKVRDAVHGDRNASTIRQRPR